MKSESKAKLKVLRAIRETERQDLSTLEIVRATKLAKPTVLGWLRVLETEGRIEVSRRVGNVVLWRAKGEK